MLNPNHSPLPSTGQVLVFLVECFGECKGKGVRKPMTGMHGTRNGEAGPDWAHYKRIQRLAGQCKQREAVSTEIEDALVDAVAALFDVSLQNGHATGSIREMNLQERLKSGLLYLRDANPKAPRVTLALVFWIVYFIEHHEWLCPQLEAAHDPHVVLWEWVQHVTHFYTNTFADSVRVNPWLFAGLPCDLSWNMPIKQTNGSVVCPVCHAISWWENRLNVEHRENWPSLLNGYLSKADAKNSVRRWKRGTNTPGLETIKRWANYPWKYHDPHSLLSAERLKAVLLWTRALQFAIKTVEKRFGLDSVWALVDWHNRAVASVPIKSPDSVNE
jgi:hypothetical protein